MTPDLEGLCQHTAPPPSDPGMISCPETPFSIGTAACASRQVMLTRNPQFRGCDMECAHFSREAYEHRLKTLPISTPAPQEDAEEDCPMDVPKLDRKLPEGATVSKSGRVWKGSAEIRPCLVCPTGWMGKQSKACGKCSPNNASERAARMRQAKAAKHSPEPKPVNLKRLAKKLATPLPPEERAKFPKTYWEELAENGAQQVEALAQQLAAKVLARAAEILRLQVTP